jgi:hypothetical protein
MIAFLLGMVEVECTSSSEWFLTNLGDLLNITNTAHNYFLHSTTSSRFELTQGVTCARIYSYLGMCSLKPNGGSTIFLIFSLYQHLSLDLGSRTSPLASVNLEPHCNVWGQAW